MQIKTTMRYHLTPVQMTIVKTDTKRYWQDVEKREPSYTVSGNANCCSRGGKE